jgi:hypothetical protein
MSATAGGRRRDDVRLALHVGTDVCFIPLRNAYSEWCVWMDAHQVAVENREFLSVRHGRSITAEAQRKAKDLTQGTQRKAENIEKDNRKSTATAARFDETEPAATESTPRADDTFRLAV